MFIGINNDSLSITVLKNQNLVAISNFFQICHIRRKLQICTVLVLIRKTDDAIFCRRIVLRKYYHRKSKKHRKQKTGETLEPRNSEEALDDGILGETD